LRSNFLFVPSIFKPHKQKPQNPVSQHHPSKYDTKPGIDVENTHQDQKPQHRDNGADAIVENPFEFGRNLSCSQSILLTEGNSSFSSIKLRKKNILSRHNFDLTPWFLTNYAKRLTSGNNKIRARLTF
jgi:hypothetical protein